MRRICKETVSATCLLWLIGTFVALMGCGYDVGSDESEASAATELTITVWPSGRGGAQREWTLRCDPPGGTLPEPARACSALSAELLKPVPPETICTQIYGGPQVARVRGRLEGRPVDAEFSRTNGCEIHRWNQLQFLFPVKI